MVECEFVGWDVPCRLCTSANRPGCTFSAHPKALAQIAQAIEPWSDLNPGCKFFFFFRLSLFVLSLTIFSFLFVAIALPLARGHQALQRSINLLALADEASLEAARDFKTAIKTVERLCATVPPAHIMALSQADMLALAQTDSLDLELIEQRLARGPSEAQRIAATFRSYSMLTPLVSLFFVFTLYSNFLFHFAGSSF
jgi:hypothetical protein